MTHFSSDYIILFPVFRSISTAISLTNWLKFGGTWYYISKLKYYIMYHHLQAVTVREVSGKSASVLPFIVIYNTVPTCKMRGGRYCCPRMEILFLFLFWYNPSNTRIELQFRCLSLPATLMLTTKVVNNYPVPFLDVFEIYYLSGT